MFSDPPRHPPPLREEVKVSSDLQLGGEITIQPHKGGPRAFLKSIPTVAHDTAATSMGREKYRENGSGFMFTPVRNTPSLHLPSCTWLYAGVPAKTPGEPTQSPVGLGRCPLKHQGNWSNSKVTCKTPEANPALCLKKEWGQSLAPGPAGGGEATSSPSHGGGADCQDLLQS